MQFIYCVRSDLSKLILGCKSINKQGILSMVKLISSSKSGNYNNSSLHLQVSDGLFIPWCSEVLSSSRRDTCSVRSVSSPFVTAAVLSSSDSIVHALWGALYLEWILQSAHSCFQFDTN